MILIDNYDSFTYNIVAYFKELGITPHVYKNDEITIETLKKKAFQSIVISPGPGHPIDAGICLDVIRHFHKTKKILGICLGHQCIAHYFGAHILQDNRPTHGKTSRVFFEEVPLFKNIPQGFAATRYHSLIVDIHSLPAEIVSIAWTNDGINMAIQHIHFPLFGVQFHPEAILSEYGKVLFKNFLEI
ncbi:MAG: aminodeoxychorismate/anthranilate synthase component II [Bacteroidales bacterium]|jgi:anthranilate synthase/aminodeoxychorismate synthase-like glutamine amidotransferase|nr:aminodeoxychorismate/anthranilate synthase component II [Bacteroidales bacterium]